jgi:Bacterial extracellular solute-binding protein
MSKFTVAIASFFAASSVLHAAEIKVLSAGAVEPGMEANGAAVLEHVIKGTGNEIGFGAITEIKLYESKGLRYVGPLPAEVQNYTRYDAVMMQGSRASDAVQQVLKLMQEPKAKAAFVKAGVQ